MHISATDYLRSPATAELLFDHIPDIVFFVKDLQCRYVVVNQTLVQRCGATSKTDLIGSTSSEVLGTDLARRHEEQDKQVLRSGEPLLRLLELHNLPSQEPGWCLTTKVPLSDDSGESIGLIGISQDLKWSAIDAETFENISAAVKFAEDRLSEAPTVESMARVANMSTYQLDRRMKRVFGISTGKWLLKERISRARERLIDSSEAIAEVGFAVGYTDQGAFTRQFRRVTGLTPSKFRKLSQRR